MKFTSIGSLPEEGKWMETERLGGFRILMKREVLRRTENQGGLDKWTDLGLFDSDISVKAREACSYRTGIRTRNSGLSEMKRAC